MLFLLFSFLCDPVIPFLVSWPYLAVQGGCHSQHPSRFRGPCSTKDRTGILAVRTYAPVLSPWPYLLFLDVFVVIVSWLVVGGRGFGDYATLWCSGLTRGSIPPGSHLVELRKHMQCQGSNPDQLARQRASPTYSISLVPYFLKVLLQTSSKISPLSIKLYLNFLGQGESTERKMLVLHSADSGLNITNTYGLEHI